MDAYEQLEMIGYGSFGRVAKIRRKYDGREFVWKEMDFGKMNDKEKQLIVSEVNILRGFKHPYIVRYYDRIIDRDAFKIYIIMEFCDRGDLAATIKRNKQNNIIPDERHVWRIALQLCLALEQCHCRKEGKILHRDIKPANILLDKDNNVKLGDFGLARIMGDQSILAHTTVGTPYYMSPEQINDQPYDERSDVWGLGCVLYEYCQGHPPFEANSQLSLATKIKAGRYKPLLRHSNEIASFIALCLSVDSARRPSVEELLSLPCLSFRLKEKKLSNHYHELKRKEDELHEREAVIAAKEADIRRREAILEERERDVLSTPDKAAEVMTTPPSRTSASSARYSSEASTPPHVANPTANQLYYGSPPSVCSSRTGTPQRYHQHPHSHVTRQGSLGSAYSRPRGNSYLPSQ
eukprot:TRINITY_DN7747_c0_g1_i1.p1 TRINITY_DN7747_c0_g1~~TRINITY_DN7747_c0_g1_i1.p1  ORF type:complete len:408 (+),score=82.64 TRINITY_DN7747_c0_g1_i1:58-1281(+)